MKKKIIQEWQKQYKNEKTGKRTAKLVPNTEIRLKHKNLEIDYYLSQYLTGHRNIGTYLKKYKIIKDSFCRECKEMEDSPEHTFETCEKITRIKEKYGITKDILMACFEVVMGSIDTTKYRYFEDSYR